MRLRTRPAASSILRHFVAAAVLASLLLDPVSAVRISFQNCLPNTYRFGNPPPLQWVPLYADASYTGSRRRTLQVTVWGNVTGSQDSSRPLPPGDDSYWRDNRTTNGKIVREPDPDVQSPALTTLTRKINVLTYEPWNDAVDFCDDGLINGTCPLPPVFEIRPDRGSPTDQLPAVNLTHDFFSSYALSSFSTTLIIINGDPDATNIGCVSATVTPSLGSIGPILKYVPLLILLLTGFAVVFAAVFSPWGSTDVFHWTSNFSRDADLLRLVTPGFGDCLTYLQFIALTGALTLDYPGFFQPVVSQVAWSTLMFNQSLVSNSGSWDSVVDGIYVTNGTYGLQKLGQLTGMAQPDNIWAGMMVWLCVLTVAVFLLIQLGFAAQWLYYRLSKVEEEDLRSKNFPFTVGNVVRIIYNFFLLPIVSFSTFQFVITGHSYTYITALSAVVLAALVAVTAWLLYVIITTRPKLVLFDDLAIVLRLGPLYNTFSDDLASFTIMPVLLTFIRGLAIGAVQPSGITQVVLLAICEIIQILTLNAFHPYPPATSMNAYHTLFSVLRLIIILLMVSFIPILGVTDGPKGWIGYVILVIHGAILVLGFFLNALQTIIEVAARMLGAGGNDANGLTRGGLTKIFGMRELSRRGVTKRGGPSRASQLSTTAMLDVEESSKGGYTMPSGRVRSESAGSIGGLTGQHRLRAGSALGSSDMNSAMHRHIGSESSYLPDTPGDASTVSFLASAGTNRRVSAGLVPIETADPYYRPPRRRQGTLSDQPYSDKGSGATVTEFSPLEMGPIAPGDAFKIGGEISRGHTPMQSQAQAGGSNMALNLPMNRPDYATRESDFYYGVRGPALKSDGPGRKLGTGPADPTGPVATAAGWFKSMIGGKSKEKGKGFEVVRSTRMPPSMIAPGGGFGDDLPPEGIPVAMGVIRNGPIDSDDEDEQPGSRLKNKAPAREDTLVDISEPRDAKVGARSSSKPRRRPTKHPRSSSGHLTSVATITKDDDNTQRTARQKTQAVNSADDATPLTGPVSDERPTLAPLPFERSASQDDAHSVSSINIMDEFRDIELRAAQQEQRPPSGVLSLDANVHRRVSPVGSVNSRGHGSHEEVPEVSPVMPSGPDPTRPF